MRRFFSKIFRKLGRKKRNKSFYGNTVLRLQRMFGYSIEEAKEHAMEICLLYRNVI